MAIKWKKLFNFKQAIEKPVVEKSVVEKPVLVEPPAVINFEASTQDIEKL